MIEHLLAAVDLLGPSTSPDPHHLAAVQPAAPGGKNPFDGVIPNFNVFGIRFTQAWQKLLAGIWGIAFVVVAFGAIRAVIELQHAKRGGYQASVHEHTESAKRSGIALAGLAALGIIFGAIVALF